jgi:DNA-binding CsgD family transcriptional regulator
VTPALLGTMAQIALRRDNPAVASDYLRRAQRHVDDGIGVIAEELTWKLALYQDAAGHPDHALDTLAPLYTAFPDRLYLILLEPSAGPQMVRLALNAGATDQAEAAVAASRVSAETNPDNASLVGAAYHAEGLLRGKREILQAAVSSLRASPRVYERASALEDAGIAEHAGGDRAAAVRLLKEALAGYALSGARRDASRVQRKQRHLGIRADALSGRRPKTGWASLTESELKVARLVAEGLTNRQIADRLVLSPHTVDTHIRHAFTKLGVSSRVGLTRLALSEDQAAHDGP